MKLHLSLASLMVLTFAGCGQVDTTDASNHSDLAATSSLIHRIQPLGVNTSCFGSGARTIRDHRVTPTRVYQQYFLQMKDCSPPASSLVVEMLGGQQWTGGSAFVTIKKNGLCLTNPVSASAGGVDKGETFYQACVGQNSPSTERFRQQWLLKFNNNNVLQIQSHAAPRLGQPNGQIQCLDRQTPTEVKRVACSVHNWQIVRG